MSKTQNKKQSVKKYLTSTRKNISSVLEYGADEGYVTVQDLWDDIAFMLEEEGFIEQGFIEEESTKNIEPHSSYDVYQYPFLKHIQENERELFMKNMPRYPNGVVNYPEYFAYDNVNYPRLLEKTIEQEDWVIIDEKWRRYVAFIFLYNRLNNYNKAKLVKYSKCMDDMTDWFEMFVYYNAEEASKDDPATKTFINFLRTIKTDKIMRYA